MSNSPSPSARPLVVVVALFLLTLTGCGAKNAGPRSGPGERDPEESARVRMRLLAENLRQRYSADVVQRPDGKWEVNFPESVAPLIKDHEVAALDGLTPLVELNLAGAAIKETSMLRLRR